MKIRGFSEKTIKDYLIYNKKFPKTVQFDNQFTHLIIGRDFFPFEVFQMEKLNEKKESG